MKRSRPLALFLSVLIFISCFTVSVSAESSENLVDSDLRNWEIFNPDFTTVSIKSDDTNKYMIRVSPEQASTNPDVFYNFGGVFSLSNLKAGDSYTFSLRYNSFSEAGVSKELYHSIFSNGAVIIGLSSGVSSDFSDITQLVEEASIIIDSDNYLDYVGTDISITFNMPNIVNPCVTIQYAGSSLNWTAYMCFEDVSLVNNTEQDEENFFDKLFQFFHDLKWELIGGSCGDSDCSKSPHTSLADKISLMFNEALDGLKWFFHDLKWEIVGGSCGDSDCSKSPHISLVDKVVTGISDFFRGFGNLILYFNWDGEYTNPFESEDSPIDKVSAFFDDLIEYVDSIGTSIENILDSITGGLHIFDEFTSRFPWLKGIAMFCLAIIVLSRFIGL